jgi:hypothetical protein
MNRYEHTQNAGAAVWVPMVLGFVAMLSIALLYPFPSLFFMIGLLLALFFQFHCLTVIVDYRYITAKFGMGIIRMRFPLHQIASVKTVRNRWIYGWGIRWFPGGWILNIGGLDAVELKMRNGRTYRIGTNEPEKLNEAIEERIGR